MELSRFKQQIKFGEEGMDPNFSLIKMLFETFW